MQHTTLTVYDYNRLNHWTSSSHAPLPHIYCKPAISSSWCQWIVVHYTIAFQMDLWMAFIFKAKYTKPLSGASQQTVLSARYFMRRLVELHTHESLELTVSASWRQTIVLLQQCRTVSRWSIYNLTKTEDIIGSVEASYTNRHTDRQTKHGSYMSGKKNAIDKCLSAARCNDVQNLVVAWLCAACLVAVLSRLFSSASFQQPSEPSLHADTNQ